VIPLIGNDNAAFISSNERDWLLRMSIGLGVFEHKLFEEMRKKELRASVNETPGMPQNNVQNGHNDDEYSLDSNENVKRKSSVSSKPSAMTTLLLSLPMNVTGCCACPLDLVFLNVGSHVIMTCLILIHGEF
jgi:hypothetical protein